jgi:hypothetical protein
MTSRITAIGGKPLPLEPKKALVREKKTTREPAHLDDKSEVMEKRAEGQDKNIVKPSEAWSRLPGGKRWTGFGK